MEKRRQFKEAWLTSDRIQKLDAPAESFLLRLALAADNWGRSRAEPSVLKAQCFPHRASVRVSDVARWLRQCEEAGLVHCYKAEETLDPRGWPEETEFLELLHFEPIHARDRSQFPPSEEPNPLQEEEAVFGVVAASGEDMENADAFPETGEPPRRQRRSRVARVRLPREKRRKDESAPEGWDEVPELVNTWRYWLAHLKESKGVRRLPNTTLDMHRRLLADILRRRGGWVAWKAVEWPLMAGLTYPREPTPEQVAQAYSQQG